MSTKEVAKKYLLFELLLYVGGVLFLGAFALAAAKHTANPVTTGQILRIAFLFPLIPCSSFAGFTLAFLRVGELKKWKMVAFVVLFPLLLVLLTAFGAAILLPSIIYFIMKLFERSE